jgi:hypothetical protein
VVILLAFGSLSFGFTHEKSDRVSADPSVLNPLGCDFARRMRCRLNGLKRAAYWRVFQLAWAARAEKRRIDRMLIELQQQTSLTVQPPRVNKEGTGYRQRPH